MGWQELPFYWRMNRTEGKPKERSVDDETITLIREQNALDCRLYDEMLPVESKGIQKRVRKLAPYLRQKGK